MKSAASLFRRAAYLLPVLLAGAVGSAYANPLEDKYSLDLGLYSMSSDTTIRLDATATNRPGTVFNIEDELGIGAEDVFRLEGVWRFLPRHKLRLMYFDSSRSTRDEFSRNINFGDNTYPANAEVRTKFGFEIIELAYEYQFLHSDRYELGGSFGIHNVDFNLRLDIDAQVGSGNASGTASESASTSAPLPVLGLRGTYRIGGDFYLQGHAQFFSIEFDTYDGSLQDYQIGVLWQFTDHFGAGVAYNLFMSDLDHEDDRFKGSLDWDYEGIQFYLRAGF